MAQEPGDRPDGQDPEGWPHFGGPPDPFPGGRPGDPGERRAYPPGPGPYPGGGYPQYPGGPYPGGPYPGGEYGYGPYPGGWQRPPDNHMVWAVLVTVFCCLPLGIVSIVKASQVNTRLSVGDWAGAVKASAEAKNFAIISAVIGLLFSVGYISVFY